MASEPVAMPTHRSDDQRPDESRLEHLRRCIQDMLSYSLRVQKYTESFSRWFAVCPLFLLLLRVMIGPRA